MATTSDGASIDRTVLPAAEVPFRGRVAVALADSEGVFPEPVRPPRGAPNVLLIMGDDIGYGHMSAFGGPARTPTFDRLAAQGLSYTNFHTTPVCSASRACLLTGRNSHSVGMGAVPEASAGFPGYNASIPRSAATVLAILQQNGYGTAWVGKTHLTPLHEVTVAGPFDRWPGGMGAEYFYGFFGPGVSQWHPPLWENTTPLEAPRTPEEGYHLEADMADKTIAWIRREKSIQAGKPWIAYYAPNGHKPPVGVPNEWIEKYRGQFDDGYDRLRDRILARQKELGIVPGDTELSPWPEALPSWDELTDLDKKVGARWMEVFCAAVEHTDYQVGRIVEAVEQMGELDNTLIVYIAGDNGPTPEGGLHGVMNKLTYFNGLAEPLEEVAARMDDFGGPNSHGCYPASWAYATSTPFTYGKMVTSGGGCSTAVVVVVAGAHHRQRRHAPPVPPSHRRGPDRPGMRRAAGTDPGQRRGPDADGRREHGLHVRRRDGRGPAHHAVLRADRQPRDVSRRLVGQHPPRPGRRDRRGRRDRVVRPGRVGALRHADRLRSQPPTWPPNTRRNSKSCRRFSTARPARTTSIRWPTTPSSC